MSTQDEQSYEPPFPREFVDANRRAYGLPPTKPAPTAPTPGPWHAGGTFVPGTPDETCTIWSATPPGYQSGDMVAQYVRPADAALIVAAPELLDELRKSADTFGDLARALSLFGKELGAASCRIAEASNRAAIARATGERT